MLQANELRLDNWVSNGEGMDFTIDTSSFMDFLNEAQVNEGKVLTLEPIPLTEEWLEKFGFEWVKELYGYADKNHFIEHYQDEGYFLFHPFCTNDKDCHIKVYHVHQLQNLFFVIKGEELRCEIKK